MTLLFRCLPNREQYRTDQTRQDRSRVHNQVHLPYQLVLLHRSMLEGVLTGRSLNPPYIVHALQTWTQTTMYAEYLASYNRSDREGVEYVDERFPSFDICSTFTFVIEPIDYIVSHTSHTPFSCRQVRSSRL